MAETGIVSVEYEVFGRVQGVFFRKYTKDKGKALGLRGWVKNTDKGTVVGKVEGKATAVAEMHEGVAQTHWKPSQ